MKNSKKWLSLMLAVIFAVSTFAGCGVTSKKDTTPTPTEAGDVTATSTPAPEESKLTAAPTEEAKTTDAVTPTPASDVNTAENSDTKYNPDELTENSELALIADESGQGEYVITPKFFNDNLADGDLNGAIIYFEAGYSCKDGDTALADVLLAKGATAVVGGSDEIEPQYTGTITSRIFELLADNHSITDAIKIAESELGTNAYDYDSANGILNNVIKDDFAEITIDDYDYLKTSHQVVLGNGDYGLGTIDLPLNVYAFMPNISDTAASAIYQGLNEAIETLKTLYGTDSVIVTICQGTDVTPEKVIATMKEMPKNSIVLWAGHGYYSEDEHNCLSVGSVPEQSENTPEATATPAPGTDEKTATPTPKASEPTSAPTATATPTPEPEVKTVDMEEVKEAIIYINSVGKAWFDTTCKLYNYCGLTRYWEPGEFSNSGEERRAYAEKWIPIIEYYFANSDDDINRYPYMSYIYYMAGDLSKAEILHQNADSYFKNTNLADYNWYGWGYNESRAWATWVYDQRIAHCEFDQYGVPCKFKSDSWIEVKYDQYLNIIDIVSTTVKDEENDVTTMSWYFTYDCGILKEFTNSYVWTYSSGGSASFECHPSLEYDSDGYLIYKNDEVSSWGGASSYEEKGSCYDFYGASFRNMYGVYQCGYYFNEDGTQGTTYSLTMKPAEFDLVTDEILSKIQ